MSSVGKALFDPNEQSHNGGQQGKPLNLNQNEDSDSSLVKPKRFVKIGKSIINKVKEKIRRKPYWTEEKFRQVLKELGISVDTKDLKLFTASFKLIKKLLKSKNNIIDTYKPPPKPKPCREQVYEDVSKEDGNQEDAYKGCSNGVEIQNDQKVTGKDIQESNEDANQKDRNIKVLGEENDEKRMEAAPEEDAKQNELEEDDKDEMKKRYAAIQQQHIDATRDGQAEDLNQPEKRGMALKDLCHETFSTTYVLVHARSRLAYKIPNVHCPTAQCFSKNIGLSLGRCRKKEKRMNVFVINKKNHFVSKTVIIGCACECLVYSMFA